MKQKKINGLTFNKTTVASLEVNELDKVKGGYTETLISCEFTFCNNCTMPMPCFHP